MTHYIWKFILEEHSTPMPKGAIVRHVSMQNNKTTIWAEVDPNESFNIRHFVVIATGQEFDSDKHEFISTFFDGPFVWHLYEVIK